MHVRLGRPQCLIYKGFLEVSPCLAKPDVLIYYQKLFSALVQSSLKPTIHAEKH